MKDKIEQSKKIVLFQSRTIRRSWHENEWYFSVVDVVGALTDSVNARDYWYKMKKRVNDEEKIELSTICRQLKLEAPDGKKRATDCTNTEGIFRLSSPYHHQKLNHLSVGWRKSAKSELMK